MGWRPLSRTKAIVVPQLITSMTRCPGLTTKHSLPKRKATRMGDFLFSVKKSQQTKKTISKEFAFSLFFVLTKWTKLGRIRLVRDVFWPLAVGSPDKGFNVVMCRQDRFTTASSILQTEAATALLYGTNRAQLVALDPRRLRPTYLCPGGS